MESDDFDTEQPPRMPDTLLEAARRHAEQPELAAYSLRVGAFAHPDWRYDPEFEVDTVRNILIDLPEDVMTSDGVDAVCRAAERVYRERDG